MPGEAWSVIGAESTSTAWGALAVAVASLSGLAGKMVLDRRRQRDTVEQRVDTRTRAEASEATKAMGLVFKEYADLYQKVTDRCEALEHDVADLKRQLVECEVDKERMRRDFQTEIEALRSEMRSGP